MAAASHSCDCSPSKLPFSPESLVLTLSRLHPHGRHMVWKLQPHEDRQAAACLGSLAALGAGVRVDASPCLLLGRHPALRGSPPSLCPAFLALACSPKFLPRWRRALLREGAQLRNPRCLACRGGAHSLQGSAPPHLLARQTVEAVTQEGGDLGCRAKPQPGAQWCLHVKHQIRGNKVCTPGSGGETVPRC